MRPHGIYLRDIQQERMTATLSITILVLLLLPLKSLSEMLSNLVFVYHWKDVF